MKSSWKKILQTTGWLGLTTVGIALLVAAVQKKDLKTCTDVKVELSGAGTNVFMEEKEIMRVLNSNGSIVGKPLETINLQLLESRLEKDKWIKNAELFFDNNDVLQVMVEERVPIARIFTIAGNSFYIDSAGKQLPLSDVSVRVPMFTGYPFVGKTSHDSTLMTTIKELATYINTDDFWNAQVSQVDITPQRTFEMIPTIGNHVVKLGRGKDIEEKFDRLYSFYKQVWTKVGLEKYAIIDVQYNDQVIATRKGVWTMNVDSAKVREAFETMLETNKPDTIDNVTAAKPVIIKPTGSQPKKIKKEEFKPVVKVQEIQRTAVKKEPENKQVPKAVMQKKE